MSRLRKRPSEQGSLPLALLVAIIVAGIVVVLVARTLTAQRQVQFDQAYHGSLPPAEAGAEIAKSRLNERELLYSDWDAEGDDPKPPVDFEVGEPTRPETEIFDDGRTFTWFMTKGDGFWRVDTTGSDPRADSENPTERHVVATLSEAPLVDLAAFADVLLNLGGNNTTDSYNPATGEWCTGNGLAGSNGTVRFQSGGNIGLCQREHLPNTASRTVDQVVLYDFDENDPDLESTEELPGGRRCGRAGGGGGPEPDPDTDEVILVQDPDHDNCKDMPITKTPPAGFPGPDGGVYPKADIFEDPRDLTTFDALAFMAEAFEACDEASDGAELVDFKASNFLGEISTTALAPPAAQTMASLDFPMDRGRFSCWNNAIFDVHTTLADEVDRDNPVVLFVRDEVIFERDGGQKRVRVNCPIPSTGPANARCGPMNLDDEFGFPMSDHLWIFVQGEGPVKVRGNSDIAGVIWAPEARCEGAPLTGSSAGVNMYGSMICQTIRNQGGWAFHYDDTLGEEGDGNWYRSTWEEVEQQSFPAAAPTP